MNFVLIGLFAYIIIQFAIAFYVSRRIKSEKDYLLAGNSLGPGIAVFTIFATWFGAETCIGSASVVYTEGLGKLVHDPFGYTICLLLMGLLLAVPLWKLKIVTLADLFRIRYGNTVEKFVGIIIIPTSILWGAAQIRAFGHVLSASSEMTTTFAISVAAAIVIVYTSFGGLLADAINDVIQGITLIIGLAILFITVFFIAPESGTSFVKLIPMDKIHFPGSQEGSLLGGIEMWMVPILGSVITQELVSRTLASRSPQVAKYSAITAAGIYLVVGLMPVMLGLAAINILPGIEASEQILPLLAQKYLSPVFYIVFAGALLAAILSTVDSTLLAAGSIASHNILVPFFGIKSEYKKVRMARVCVVIAGIIAYVLAVHAGSIYELVEQTNGFGASGLFIITILALFSRQGGTLAAMAALILSTGFWIYATYIDEALTPYPFLTSLALALFGYLSLALAEKFLHLRGHAIPQSLERST